VTRGKYDLAKHDGETMLELARRKPGEPGDLLEAERSVGAVLMAQGHQREALDHFENGIGIYDPARHHQHSLQFASDPGLSCMLWSLIPLWQLGYPERALARATYALDLATNLRHAFTLSFAASFTAWVHLLCGDWEGARRLGANGMQLSSDRGFSLWLAVSTVFHGRALAKCGEPDAGIAALRSGIAAFRKLGAQINLPHLMSLLAESHLELGQTDEGLAVLQEAIDTANHIGEHLWDADLIRLRGDFLLATKAGGRTVAEHYEQAADIARRQDAKSLELRAIMSLVQLRHVPGDRAQLQSLVEWFGDQQSSGDLERARALLR
jgi:predicted ATPase